MPYARFLPNADGCLGRTCSHTSQVFLTRLLPSTFYLATSGHAGHVRCPVTVLIEVVVRRSDGTFCSRVALSRLASLHCCMYTACSQRSLRCCRCMCLLCPPSSLGWHHIASNGRCMPARHQCARVSHFMTSSGGTASCCCRGTHSIIYACVRYCSHWYASIALRHCQSVLLPPLGLQLP
jgi:hypothetical protein